MSKPKPLGISHMINGENFPDVVRIDAYSEQSIYRALRKESLLHPGSRHLSEATLGRLAEAANESLRGWK